MQESSPQCQSVLGQGNKLHELARKINPYGLCCEEAMAKRIQLPAAECLMGVEPRFKQMAVIEWTISREIKNNT